MIDNIDLTEWIRWFNKFVVPVFHIEGREELGKAKKNTIDIMDENGNWVTHTWHHHQNGKDLFPVPSSIHNASSGGFAHAGGDSILGGDDNLVGLFDDPIFK